MRGRAGQRLRLGGLYLLLGGCGCPTEDGQKLTKWEPSQARDLTVLPALSAPLPDHQSAAWCATLPLAWSELKRSVFKEPLRIQGAEALSEDLNDASATEADLPPGSWYAAAGRIQDGIVERIRREMAQRFPAGPRPEFPGGDLALVAYGYLKAGVKFTIPFFENDEPLEFRDFKGSLSRVASFGIRGKDSDAYSKLRHQVAVLYASYRPRSIYLDEFIIDPSKDSSPAQLILARVQARPTLAETLAEVENKIAESKTSQGLDSNDTFLVPNIRFQIEHHFKELEGSDKPFLNRGFESLWLVAAVQAIYFKLDRSGAELESEAKLAAASISSHYVFDRPFLVILKRRGAAHPFFVLWVAGAGILEKFP